MNEWSLFMGYSVFSVRRDKVQKLEHIETRGQGLDRFGLLISSLDAFKESAMVVDEMKQTGH